MVRVCGLVAGLVGFVAAAFVRWGDGGGSLVLAAVSLLVVAVSCAAQLDATRGDR